MTPLPNLQSRAIDESGRFLGTWVGFFGQLVGRGGQVVVQTLTGSPASFTAPTSGQYLVTGGADVGIFLVRGRVTLPTGMSFGFVPVSQGDVVAVAYTSPPSVTFIPS